MHFIERCFILNLLCVRLLFLPLCLVSRQEASTSCMLCCVPFVEVSHPGVEWGGLNTAKSVSPLSDRCFWDLSTMSPVKDDSSLESCERHVSRCQRVAGVHWRPCLHVKLLFQVN